MGTAARSTKSQRSVRSLQHESIAAIESELRGGNPDVAGLCLALSDWWAELRILEGEWGASGD